MALISVIRAIGVLAALLVVEAGVRVVQKMFPTLDVELIRGIILLERNAFHPAITEEAMRIANQFQKQAGVVKSDFPYDKVVAVQFKHLWEQ